MELNSDDCIKVDVQGPTEVIISDASASSPLAAPVDKESAWQRCFRGGNKYPERPGMPDCGYYLRTGFCRFKTTCTYNHPADRNLAVEERMKAYPERKGKPECQHFLKTGTCKFGPACIFHHPKDTIENLERNRFNFLGYPLRSYAGDCLNYLRSLKCKFRNKCRFNHPELSHSMLLLHTLTSVDQQSHPKGLICSLLASPHWQDPSTYAQIRNPEGLAEVPSEKTFPEKVESESTLKIQQQEPENGQSAGTSSQSKTAMDSSLQKGDKYPVRPGESDCPFYIEIGDCKFGAGCRFNHPKREKSASKLSPAVLPSRPGEVPCFFYHSYGFCKYGTSCKFDHLTADPKGVVTDSPSTSASSDAPPVQQPLGSSSQLPASTLSSESSPVAVPSTNSQKMNSDDENAEA